MYQRKTKKMMYVAIYSSFIGSSSPVCYYESRIDDATNHRLYESKILLSAILRKYFS